jgi:hypothetical protein
MTAMSEQIVFYISFAGFLAYVIFIVATFGVPASVSDSFYLLNEKKKDLGYLFTLWCYLTGITAIILMAPVLEDEWFQAVGFFPGAALCFVGTAPLFKKDRQHKIHVRSAFVCAVSALLWIVLSGYWLAPVTLLLPAVIAAKKWPQSIVFWAEYWVFFSTYFTLFFLI